MEVVQKAVNDAVHAVRNSPLLRRRFGDNPATAREEEVQEENLSPEKDHTPFVQGFSYKLEYLGKSNVDQGQEQDHGCCDQAVETLWNESSTNVSVRVTTNTIRMKSQQDGTVLYEFPVLRMSYCGIDKTRKNAVSLVAKESEGVFSCYVFRATSKEKAYAMALSVTKAFYLACQILQEQQGLFPPTPNRETLFEPQREDDTKESPARPQVHGSPQIYHIRTQPGDTEEDDVDHDDSKTTIKVTRPSITSIESQSSNIDEDFVRLAKSRSNPDILRSTVDLAAVTHPSLEVVKMHADNSSRGATPYGTPHGSQENLLATNH